VKATRTDVGLLRNAILRRGSSTASARRWLYVLEELGRNRERRASMMRKRQAT